MVKVEKEMVIIGQDFEPLSVPANVTGAWESKHLQLSLPAFHFDSHA
jgi:hypothetical protein